MPRRLSSEFGSALPKVAEFKPKQKPTEEQSLVPERERAPSEQAQLMWDIYQDLKNAWVEFARNHKDDKSAEEAIPSDTALTKKRRFDLLDPENSLSQEFHATPQFQKLHARLAKLWADQEAQTAWRAEMERAANQWAEVNGSWQEYLALHTTIAALEQRYDDLQKEKFIERSKPPRSRSRTLSYDIADIELALQEERTRIKALSRKNPELAAKILASEFKERRRELHSPKQFMMFRSRRAVIEKVEDIVTQRDTLRLIVLEGEAGSGKTTLARILAQHFTNEDPLQIEVGEKTKADRALFADKILEAGGSPTAYQPVLQALTGKERPTDLKPQHRGRAVFLDEFNKMSNDEAGIVATKLDSVKVGSKTGYHLNGANPDDQVQPNALVLAAQNPASQRFRGRTNFTPEVKRKMEIVPVEYFSQTTDDPELYESFLVASQDQDGRIRAARAELAPAWQTVENLTAKTKQDQLIPDSTSGGALWRLAQMLHESYENLAKRPNALTQTNPDAWISGRVLPPGDVFKWLEEYKTEAKKGISLEYFLSQRMLTWIETSFANAADAGDKELYLDLAKRFHLVEKTSAGEFTNICSSDLRIGAEFLTERQAAELSPRVPRPVIKTGEAPPPAEAFPKQLLDCADSSGKKHRRLEVRLEPYTDRKRWARKGTTEPVYRIIGKIKECAAIPALVNQIVLQNEAKPEQKLVMEDAREFEALEPPVEQIVRETREKFGNGFLGIEEIEKSFTLQDGTKLIDLSPAERQRATELLAEKLAEPDIQEFLKTASPEALKKDWLLVLRVDKLGDGTALTIKAMQEQLAPDMAARGQGKLLYNVDWYPSESFYTTQTPQDSMHWQLVSRAVLPETKGQTHRQQTALLKAQARALKLNPDKIRRRKPIETIYDTAMVLRITGQYILKGEYDWSEEKSSDGSLVIVGSAFAVGASVLRYDSGDSRDDLGASLSR